MSADPKLLDAIQKASALGFSVSTKITAINVFGHHSDKSIVNQISGMDDAGFAALYHQAMQSTPGQFDIQAAKLDGTTYELVEQIKQIRKISMGVIVAQADTGTQYIQLLVEAGFNVSNEAMLRQLLSMSSLPEAKDALATQLPKQSNYSKLGAPMPQPQVTPAIKKIMTGLASFGFDISTKQSATSVASLMANGFDLFVGQFDDAGWSQVYSQVVKQETGADSYVNMSPEWEINPKLVDKTLIKTLQDLKAKGVQVNTLSDALYAIQYNPPANPDVAEDLNRLTEQEYQSLLSMTAGFKSMRHIIVAQIADDETAGFMATLFNLGFKIYDYASGMKVLSLIPNHPLAKKLSAVPQEQWKPLFDEALQTPKKEPKAPSPAEPAAPAPAPQVTKKMPEVTTPAFRAPVAPTPQAPPQAPSAPPEQAKPVGPTGPMAPASPHMQMDFKPPQMQPLSIQPGETPKPHNKKILIGELANQYESLAKQLPEGAKKVGFGESVGILIKTQDGRNDVPAKGGAFVFLQPPKGSGEIKGEEAMVIGSDGKRTLYVTAFPSGMFKAWNVGKDEVRVSSGAGLGMGTGLPKREGGFTMKKLVSQVGPPPNTSPPGEAQDMKGNPIMPGNMIMDPNQPTSAPVQISQIMPDGGLIYEDAGGQKVTKEPGAQVEVIKQEQPGSTGGPAQAPQTPGVGGPNMIS